MTTDATRSTAPAPLADPPDPLLTAPAAADATPDGALAPALDGQIATLAPPPPVVVGVPDDPRTGEPRIPWIVRIASWLSIAAVAGLAASLLVVYWDAVPKENFANASWLMAQFVTEPGSIGRVLLAVAVTVIALVIAVPLALTGYYAWAGYRWSRVCAVIGAVASFGALTLNFAAWTTTIPLAVAAATLLWLPGASRYFDAWHARRHLLESYAPPTVDVFYGPLPRYR